jgi:hypothetical protein
MLQGYNEMTKITNSIQYHKSNRKYKSENGRTRTYNECRLKSSFRKFYGRYSDLVCDYKLSLAHMLNDLFHTNF